jgi:hypothetical protein
VYHNFHFPDLSSPQKFLSRTTTKKPRTTRLEKQQQPQKPLTLNPKTHRSSPIQKYPPQLQRKSKQKKKIKTKNQGETEKEREEQEQEQERKEMCLYPMLDRLLLKFLREKTTLKC